VGTYSVCIASRGRPNALIAVIVGMWRLRSGKNDIRFVAGLDDDESASHQAVLSVASDGIPVVASVAPRPASLGAVNNRLISEQKADAYIVTTDRAFILTPSWDEQIRRDMDAHPGRVLWLSSPQDPDPTHPVLPHDYIRTVGQWSPEIFPFWFDDTWNAEIDYLAHGDIIKIPVHFAGERGKTTNARDIAFWCRVFDALRPRRVKLARELCNIGPKELTERIGYLDALAQARTRAAEANGERFGDDTPPTTRYLAAKAEAEKMLAAGGHG
jgi:hypothetical protein